MPRYGEKSYWDNFYQKNPEYEWYCPFESFRQAFSNVPRDAKILIVGCGNSPLPRDLLEDGFRNLTCVDYSEPVIQHMRKKNRRFFPYMQFFVQDVRDMDFPDGVFDLVIDKGTLDAILCGNEGTKNAAQMLHEIQRVLHPGGQFYLVTYGTPGMRMNHLRQRFLPWDIRVFELDTPNTCYLYAMNKVQKRSKTVYPGY